MLVSSATIHFKLRTQKVLSDGTSPIMIVIQYHGRKEKSTGFSCRIDQWDTKNECFKRRMSNYTTLNKVLFDMKNGIVNKKLYFEQNHIEYNASMLLEKDEVSSADSRQFDVIASNMTNERKLGYKRQCAIATAYNSLSNFIGRKNTLITELDNAKITAYIKSLENKISTNTIVNYVSTIFSVIQYAYDNEIINVFPSKAKSYFKQKHKKAIRHRALNETDILRLKHYFWDMNGDITDRYDKKFSLGLYLLSYSCFGLAPIDILKLRQNQLTLVEVKGISYYKIETQRSKTNRSVKVFAERDMCSNLIDPFITTERTHFLPIFNDEMNEKEMVREARNLYEVVNRNLKRICEDIGIPKFTLYSARHSFCSMAVKDGKNLGLIASAMGRSVTGMSTYIKNLNTDEDLVNLTDL